MAWRTTWARHLELLYLGIYHDRWIFYCDTLYFLHHVETSSNGLKTHHNICFQNTENAGICTILIHM